MKIAITSTGPDLDSTVDERFGRARYLLVMDLETGNFESVDNMANMEAMQGAGVQASHEIVERGVDWLLTGHVGPKAFQALSTAGVSMGVGASGTVQETLDRFRAGAFKPAEAVDVRKSSKWG